MESHSSDNQNEVRSTTGNDAEEFAQAFRKIEPSLHRRFMRSTGNKHDAEDIVQDTALRAWQFLTRRLIKALPGWVHEIGRTLSHDHHRKSEKHKKFRLRFHDIRETDAARPRNQSTPDMTDPSVQCEYDELFQILPEECRDIYRESVKEKYTHKELAEKYGVHVNTIANKIRQAELFLERKFGERKRDERNEG